MAETTTVEGADKLDEVIDVLVELMRTATRPDVLEAQRVLLQRLAHQGDVFPSRIPPPLNITEIGGYLNLLQELGQEEIRSGAVASALGVAGPPPGAAGLGGVVPVGFGTRGLSRAASDRARGDPGEGLRASAPCAPAAASRIATGRDGDLLGRRRGARGARPLA